MLFPLASSKQWRRDHDQSGWPLERLQPEPDRSLLRTARSHSPFQAIAAASRAKKRAALSTLSSRWAEARACTGNRDFLAIPKGDSGLHPETALALRQQLWTGHVLNLTVRLLKTVARIQPSAAIAAEQDQGFASGTGHLLAVVKAAGGITASAGTYTQAAGEMEYTVSLDGAANNGADLLIAAYSSATGSLIGWQVVNRGSSRNLRNTSYSGSFNYAAAALNKVDNTSIVLRAPRKIGI